MNRADAGLLELAFDAEIEVGRVDADERGGAFAQRSREQIAPHGEQAWQVRDHFDEAHHAQFFRRMPQLHTGGGHMRTANAGKARSGNFFAQASDEVCAEQIP